MLALAPTGDLQRVTVNNGTLSSANVATLAVPAGTSNFSLARVRAHALAVRVGVDREVRRRRRRPTRSGRWTPATASPIVDEIDLSGSIAAKSIRELAFDSRGNLFISHFVNTTSTPPGESIHVISAPPPTRASIADNSSQPYFTQSPVLTAQFNGMDVASALLDYKTAGVKVDIRNRSTVQQFFGASPLAEVRQKVQAGYNGGSWNGMGIISSNAAAQPGYAVGYGDAGDARAGRRHVRRRERPRTRRPLPPTRATATRTSTASSTSTTSTASPPTSARPTVLARTATSTTTAT